MTHRQEIRALLRSIHAGDFRYRKAISFGERFIAHFHERIGSEVDGACSDGSTSCMSLSTDIYHREIRKQLTRRQINPLSMQSEESHPCCADEDRGLQL